MVHSGIRFNDCFFSEPMDLDACALPKCAGLFGILIQDPNWAPRAFRPIYFGEFGNNAPALVLQRAGASGTRLFVSVLPMPFSTTQQRLSLRGELIGAYNPVFQSNAESDNRHQSTHMLELEPPPRRRPIGFMPFVAEPVAD